MFSVALTAPAALALAGFAKPRYFLVEPQAQAISVENGVVSPWPSGFDGPGPDVAY